ncbi:uncharacterized protein G2W53_003860 [Senna tora]|uniref:Uncharacterized protein n=1 Tax=Senna tora TaxID=362788 RepID=A0A835CJN1_9FABA|nr:uncharacterized protein G2W53_003860 [Senna tora]
MGEGLGVRLWGGKRNEGGGGWKEGWGHGGHGFGMAWWCGCVLVEEGQRGSRLEGGGGVVGSVLMEEGERGSRLEGRLWRRLGHRLRRRREKGSRRPEMWWWLWRRGYGGVAMEVEERG